MFIAESIVLANTFNQVVKEPIDPSSNKEI